MKKLYFFAPFVASLILVGAGCSRTNINTGTNAAIQVSNNNANTNPTQLPAPSNTNSSATPAPNGGVVWPGAGAWSTLKVTTSRGTVSEVTRLAVAFSASGRDYEGVEVATTTAAYGGRGGSVIAFWLKGDRFGASSRYAAALNLPGGLSRTMCQTFAASGINLDQFRSLEGNYYQNLSSLGSEDLTLANGKTLTTTKYQVAFGGQNSLAWINADVPFLAVKAVASGTTSELTDYGTAGKVPVYSGAQLALACGL